MTTGPHRFYLNTLRGTGRKLKDPPRSGWTPEDSLLLHLKEDIEVKGELKAGQVADAVPSVFARPIQFYEAFRSEDNPLHKAVVGEWRGLLALIALKDVLGLKIEFEKYDIPTVAPQIAPFAGATDLRDTQEPVRRLHAILSQQLPRPVEDWNHFFLIRCAGAVLGATCPWTFVYTAAQMKCPEMVRWRAASGRLTDPVPVMRSLGTHFRHEVALLLRWLDLQLAEHEATHWHLPPHLLLKGGEVNVELVRWHHELEALHIPAPPAATLATGEEALPLPLQTLLRPIHHDHRRPQSTLLLKKDLGPPVLVIPEAPATQYQERRVHGPLTLRLLDRTSCQGASGPANTLGGHGTEPVPYAWVRPEIAFFPNKLAGVELGEAAWSFGTAKYALPLTPAFFEYFSVKTLVDKDMLKVSTQGGNITVRLTLTLDVAETDPPEWRTLTIEKTYTQSDVVQPAPSPALAIWPNFVADDWKEYLVGCVAPEKNYPLGCAPLMPGGKTESAARPDGSQQLARLWTFNQPPLGFSLSEVEEGHTIPIGLILWKPLTAQTPDSSLGWEVAVDFGTSNTQIFWKKEGEDRAHPLPMRVLTAPLSRYELTYGLVLERILYPQKEVLPPRPTAATRESVSLLSDGTPQAPHMPQFSFELANLQAATLLGNIKWGTFGGAETDRPLRAYLRGVLRFVLCEARTQGVGRLKVHWSYPLSLPYHARSSLRDFWSVEASKLNHSSQLKLTVGSGVPESEALCRFLADNPAIPVHASQALVVGLDIGGGSTDIAFWGGGSLKDQLSWKLAGNDLLSPFAHLPALMDDLASKCLTGQVAQKAFKEGSNVLALRHQHPSFCVNWLLVQPQSEGRPVDPRKHPVATGLGSGDLSAASNHWLPLRSLVYLFYAALGFYVGLHSRKYLGEVKHLVVYLGGRGTAMLPWIKHNSDDLETFLLMAIKEGLAQPPGTSTDVTVVVHSPAVREMDAHTKEEVVRGLLAKEVQGKDETSIHIEAPPTFLGERYWRGLNGADLAWDQKVPAIDLRHLQVPGDNDMESTYIHNFVATLLKRELVVKLGLDPRMAVLRIDRIQLEGRIKKAANDKEEISSIFAIELKALMDKYVELTKA